MIFKYVIYFWQAGIISVSYSLKYSSDIIWCISIIDSDFSLTRPGLNTYTNNFRVESDQPKFSFIRKRIDSRYISGRKSFLAHRDSFTDGV